MSTSHPPGQLPAGAPGTKAAKKKRKKVEENRVNGNSNDTVNVNVNVKETKKSAPILAENSGTDSNPGVEEQEAEAEEESDPVAVPDNIDQKSPLAKPDNLPANTLKNGTYGADAVIPVQDTGARFEALVKDRDALRLEVTQLRESLEELQAKHESAVDTAREELQESRAEKEHAEEQYQNLIGKVNTIKAQLGERLKADAADLAQARSHIETLEEENSSLQQQQSQQSNQIDTLTSDAQVQAKELSSLRNRSNLSQQNWLKEREDLIEQEAYTREQYENTEQAMREWEVLALEERSIRKDLDEKVGDLEEQLSNLKESYERAASERDSQSTTVDGLQKALQEIQSARKKELREVVESSQAEASKLHSQLAEAQEASTSAAGELESVRKELDRALPFEKEVKEKNLLIGKLRHEAVTLNEHLTKALRFLKRGKPEDNVDRQIVTNHLLQFLTLDRSDPKKFQILQLIAALLSWTDEQRQQAGLSRPGGTSYSNISNSNNNSTSSSPIVSPGFAPIGASGGSSSTFNTLRPPSTHSRSQSNSRSQLVALHRSKPSTPASSLDPFQDTGSIGGGGGGSGARRSESLAELWQGFLEQESGQVKGSVAVEGRGGGRAGRGDDGDEHVVEGTEG